MPIALDGLGLTCDAVVAVARDGEPVELASEARDRIEASRERVRDLLARDDPVYGVNTGVGDLCQTQISPDQVDDLQINLLRSHACGVGDPMPGDAVRATMLLKASALARGKSGVRVELVETLVDLLNEGVTPVVPEQGSVGASGDLVPLAHVGLVLVGEGTARVDGEVVPGEQALDRAGLEPIRPRAKEGLALINGTEPTLAWLVLALHDAERVLEASVVAGAMSLEALMASVRPMRERVVEQRPHPGALEVAERIRDLTAGSEIVESHAGCDRVQDAYSVRCMPQVLGAVRDALDYVRATVDRELKSVTDNPLILPDMEDSATGGNFHGQPLGYAADHLALVLADLASMSERRVARLTDEDLSEGLPPFLTEDAGIRSGMMIPQYVAASLVSESKTLAAPASVDSVPTSANQEDHVAMSTIAARKARRVVDNAGRVVAVELLTVAEALDGRAPRTPGRGSRVAHEIVRDRVAPLDEDRSLSGEIETVAELVRTGELVDAVDAEVGT